MCIFKKSNKRQLFSSFPPHLFLTPPPSIRRSYRVTLILILAHASAAEQGYDSRQHFAACPRRRYQDAASW